MSRKEVEDMPEVYEKIGFVLYSTYYGPVNALTDEQAGRLFKAILADQSGKELPPMEAEDRTAYNFIKAQMNLDAAKYDRRVQANRQNGTKGGRPPKPKETEDNPKNPMGFEETEEKPPEPAAPTPEKKGRSQKDYTPEFEELWKLYPKKDNKWSAFLKYQARLKKFTHEQLVHAVTAYLEREKKKSSYPQYVVYLETLISSDKANFTQFLEVPTAAQAAQQKDSDDDWAAFFNGGKQ